jgi:hypothetical protein
MSGASNRAEVVPGRLPAHVTQIHVVVPRGVVVLATS